MYSSSIRVINLGVKVLTGFTVVFKLFVGPLILKLTPKRPSPAFLPIRISPITGIFDTTVFKVFAGTMSHANSKYSFSYRNNLRLKLKLKGQLKRSLLYPSIHFLFDKL